MIKIITRPDDQMRYSTAGDWYHDGDTLSIDVVEQNDPRHSLLIAIHELVEALLCAHNGVTQETVDHWDMILCADSDEPADVPHCPYAREHQTAEVIERIMAQALGVDWIDYTRSIG